MSEVTKPIALDETFNTTESTPRNLADVLASGLANIANNVKPDGSDISIDVPGMSANNVDDGFSELKQSLTDPTKVVQKRLPDFTISAGATNSTRANVDDVDGYKPCGIVGYTGSGTSGTALQEMYVASQETAIVYARNVTSASITITNIVVHILYIKV